MNVFTLEVYCSEGQPAWNLHEGNFESNRDSLSPQMYWAHDFYAPDLKSASAKVQRLIRYFQKHGLSLKTALPKATMTLDWPTPVETA